MLNWPANMSFQMRKIVLSLLHRGVFLRPKDAQRYIDLDEPEDLIASIVYDCIRPSERELLIKLVKHGPLKHSDVCALITVDNFADMQALFSYDIMFFDLKQNVFRVEEHVNKRVKLSIKCRKVLE